MGETAQAMSYDQDLVSLALSHEDRMPHYTDNVLPTYQIFKHLCVMTARYPIVYSLIDCPPGCFTSTLMRTLKRTGLMQRKQTRRPSGSECLERPLARATAKPASLLPPLSNNRLSDVVPVIERHGGTISQDLFAPNLTHVVQHSDDSKRYKQINRSWKA